MNRRRWLYTQGGKPLPEPIEVDLEWRQPDAGPSHVSEGEVYGGLRQMDGTVTDSRKKLREWAKQNNLAHMDDFKESHAKAQEERRRAFTGEGYDTKARKEAVVEAFRELRETRRRK
jgi:hypothetical protein